MKSAVGGLLVLRSRQIIIIQRASKKKIRWWNAKYCAANALDIFTLCTFPDVDSIQHLIYPKGVRAPEAISHNPSVLACCQGEGTPWVCFQDCGSDPRWHFCNLSLSARHGPPPPGAFSPRRLTAAHPHQVQVLIAFMAVEFMLRFQLPLISRHEYLINCL